MADTCVASQKINQQGTPKKGSLGKAVFGGSIGNMLEWYDYGIYGYFAPIISNQFFPSKDPLTSLMLTFIVFGVGFFSRPLGGVVFGRMADRLGRRTTLIITVLLMGIATCAIGLTPSFATIGVAAPIIIALLRLAQGLSTGGEWGSCMSYLAEFATPHNRAFIVSWSHFSVGGGLFLGSATGLVLTQFMSQEVLNAWGWRIPFISGILIALFALYFMAKLEETPAYEAAKQTNTVTETPFKEIAKNYKLPSFVMFGVVIGWTISYWTFLSYMPTYITKILNYSMGSAFTLTSILLLVFMVCIPLAGMLADKIGRKPVMLMSAIGISVLTYPLFKVLSSTSSMTTIVFVLIALAVLEALFCGSGTVAITEIFPTSVRCSAIGLIYNITVAAFGGTAPFIVTALIKGTGNILAPTFYVIPGMVFTLLVVLFLFKETNKTEF